MAFEVIVPLVITKDGEGKDVYLYAGSPVPSGVSDDEVKRLVEGGFIKKTATEDAGNSEAERPAESGPGSAKDKWVAYAAVKGVEVDANASKEDIIAVVVAAGH